MEWSETMSDTGSESGYAYPDENFMYSYREHGVPMQVLDVLCKGNKQDILKLKKQDYIMFDKFRGILSQKLVQILFKENKIKLPPFVSDKANWAYLYISYSSGNLDDFLEDSVLDSDLNGIQLYLKMPIDSDDKIDHIYKVFNKDIWDLGRQDPTAMSKIRSLLENYLEQQGETEQEISKREREDDLSSAFKKARM